MGFDYYKTLEVSRTASAEEIKEAYRQKAVLWHPQSNASSGAASENESKHSAEEAAARFARIAEAYVVLSTPRLRAIFDQFGEERLKQGAPDENGVYVGAWVMTEAPEKVFTDFFGANSPFADLKIRATADAVPTTGARGKAAGPKEEDTHVNLYCSLEELFSGCTKRVQIRRKRVRSGDGSVVLQQHTLTVPIRSGWKAGTVMTFPGEGDETPGKAAGDVKLTLREKPHPLYTRKGRNLVHTAHITLRQALVGCTLQLTTLDNKPLVVTVDEIVQTGSTKVVVGHGMPSAKDASKRGNVVIEFRVRFPSQLSLDAKKKLDKLLP